MHEWALAESILLAAVEAADKEKIYKITEIKVGLGQLQQIEQDIFEFALDEIKKTQDEKLRDAKIIIKTIKSDLKCTSCGNTWSFSDMKKSLTEDDSESIHFIPEVAFAHFRCPKCKSPDFEITSGRGVSILSIKGESK